MNTPGEKTFKQLWREFCKEGWKPRKPFGMAKDHRYVKPGVKGRFDESKRGVDYFDECLRVRAHSIREAFLTSCLTAATRSNCEHASTPSDWKAGIIRNRWTLTSAQSRFGFTSSSAISCEQGSVKEGPIPDNSDSLPNPSEPGEEEATSESDEHIENGLVDLELFGSDDFMEGLRKENIFGPPDGDDVNIGVAGSVDDGESDADDEDVMADNASDSEHVEGIDDIDEDEKNEDDPDTELLGITSAALRDLSETGWIRYDETHSG
ncbi:hypothetical protein PC112_g21877 [Phytophthora cactorum]|nr:hypothetical protein PC112_g21877 [Phytophthora cactorum]